MFLTRLISGIALVVIALVTIITGGWLLFGVLLAVSLIGLYEIYNVCGVWKKEAKGLAMVGFLGTIAYYILLLFDKTAYSMIGVIFILTALLFVYVFLYPKYRAEQVMAGIFGILYVPVMLSFIYQTRSMEDGNILVWLIFLCSWGSDTCAYCAGMLFGKHKMSPVLSPKKSVEGAVGGVAGAALLGAVYAFVTNQCMGKENEIWVFAFICGVGALISMVGDLAASGIKRNHNIKDYGNLIPGHGGILDRFDSVIFTAPVIYFLAALIG